MAKEKKNKLILTTIGITILGLGIGMMIGFQKVQNASSISAEEGLVKPDSINNIEVVGEKGESNPSSPASSIIGASQYTKKEWAEMKAKINSDSDPATEVFVATNGREYIITVPQGEGVESKLAETKERVEKVATAAATAEKELNRTSEDRAEAINNIKAMFGERNVEYLSGNKAQEYYRDDKGLSYFVSIPENKVVRVQKANPAFKEANPDLFGADGTWKSVNITEEEARAIATNFIKTKTGLDKETAEKVLNGWTTEVVKKNYAFLYGDEGDGVFLFEIGIEPVTGQIIRYVNSL